MTVAFVPVPVENLDATAYHWLPLTDKIASRTGDHPTVLANLVFNGEVAIALAWDVENKKALALMGYRVIVRGDDRTADVVWLTGSQKETWEPLYADFERYMREFQECRRIEMVCRKGWRPFLEGKGFRMTHVRMDRTL